MYTIVQVYHDWAYMRRIGAVVTFTVSTTFSLTPFFTSGTSIMPIGFSLSIKRQQILSFISYFRHLHLIFLLGL